MSIEIKKIELNQIAFKFIANLDRINSTNLFARFYYFVIKSLCNLRCQQSC